MNILYLRDLDPLVVRDDPKGLPLSVDCLVVQFNYLIIQLFGDDFRVAW